ncbi:MAG TPA: DUF6491 family protein [Steroidobacteraceae bacterium]
MTRALMLAWLLLGGTPSPAAAPDAPAAPPREAQILFADKGGIIDWQVVDTKTVLVKDRGGRWYKATLFGTCFDLPTATNRLAFQSNPNGTFDKFSTIIVRGQQRCQLASFVETTAPPRKSKATAVPPAAAPAP